ncbi:MAG: NUDIX hydrolase [Candidatus Peribacteria bacterium]|nr:NUDIX hydrolase [Candidatus Peribacteria bacterium]
MVVFDATFTKVLLCKRVGEADFNETFSFPGGKIERSDGDIWKGMQREKKEEL